MARDGEQQAMTAERLAAIREAHAMQDKLARMSNGSYRPSGVERELLSEVERLRAALDAAEAREECKPMTDVERLETLRGMLTREVRLREAAEAREAALLAVVRAVAQASETHASPSEYAQISRLHFSGVETAGQMREQARALLASTAEAEAGEQAAQGEA